jgi:hypothetical protein
MKGLAIGFYAAVSLVAGSSANASSIYFPSSKSIEIKNDSSNATTLGACPKVTIFTHKANIWPWGESQGAIQGKWSILDKDWTGSRLELVNTIKRWEKLPLAQKLSMVASSLDRENVRKCLEYHEELRAKELAEAEFAKRCRSLGKDVRTTSKGRFCLSDFEYAQIMLLEDQQKSIDNYKKQEMQQRRDQMQAEEAYRQEQQRQKRIEESYRRNKEFLDSLRPKEPVRCSGTYNQFGTYSYSCK